MRIYENIKYLCRERKRGIGEIERICGYQEGFLSRYKDKQEKIPCGVVVKASEILDVGVEQLMFSEIGKEMRRKSILEEMEKLEEELRILGEE